MYSKCKCPKCNKKNKLALTEKGLFCENWKQIIVPFSPSAYAKQKGVVDFFEFVDKDDQKHQSLISEILKGAGEQLKK